MVAVLLPVFLGFAGIATEIGFWYTERRAMQGAADNAAFSAAVAYTLGQPWRTEGLGVAATNGFTNGTGGVQVSVNMPPTLGNYTNPSRYNAIEVIITKPMRPTFSSVVGLATGPIVPARAVALLDSNNSDCILALSRSAAGAITLNGGTTITMPSCGIGDNSASNSAFTTKGSANTLTAGSISVVGGDYLTGSPTINPMPQTGQAPIANPYGSLAVPKSTDPSPCKGVKDTGGGTMTLDANVPGNSSLPYNKQVVTVAWPPGGIGSGTANAMVLCGDVTVNGGSTLQLNPGVYIIDGGALNAKNGTIIGNGVTIIFASSSGVNNIGTANIAGNVLVQLTSDTSGPFPGFVFFQDPRAALATKPPNASIAGTSGSYINGAVYFPGVQLTYTGNSSGGASGNGCTQLIANTIQFSGNVNITNTGCSGLGLHQIGQTHLVE